MCISYLRIRLIFFFAWSFLFLLFFFVFYTFLCFFFFFFSSIRRHPICALVTGVQTCALPICLSLIRSISAQSSSWGGGSTFGAPNLNLVISLAPLDRVLHTSSRSESQLNPTPTYALDAADKDSRRYGYSPLGRTPLA